MSQHQVQLTSIFPTELFSQTCLVQEPLYAGTAQGCRGACKCLPRLAAQLHLARLESNTIHDPILPMATAHSGLLKYCSCSRRAKVTIWTGASLCDRVPSQLLPAVPEPTAWSAAPRRRHVATLAERIRPPIEDKHCDGKAARQSSPPPSIRLAVARMHLLGPATTSCTKSTS